MPDGKTFLTRDQILSANDITTEEVEVPEWGGVVLIRKLTGRERDAYEQRILVNKKGQSEVNFLNARAYLVALSVVDETGKRVFNINDVESLGKKSSAALDRVTEAAQKLSKISDKDIDELEKPLEPIRNDSSGSSSPSLLAFPSDASSA